MKNLFFFSLPSLCLIIGLVNGFILGKERAEHFRPRFSLLCNDKIIYVKEVAAGYIGNGSSIIAYDDLKKTRNDCISFLYR